jgi:hypothetical protein
VIEQQFSDGAIVDTSCRDEWFVQLSGRVDQHPGHFDVIRFTFTVQHNRLQQRGMTSRRARSSE